MKIEKVDPLGYEKQRYEAIKESGSYVEFIALIDANDDQSNNTHIPIVSVEMSHCSRKDVALLISTLKTSLQQLQKDHPMEYLMSELFFDHSEPTVERINKDSNDDEEE